jgi:hypothetical protein
LRAFFVLGSLAPCQAAPLFARKTRPIIPVRFGLKEVSHQIPKFIASLFLDTFIGIIL